jgi:hypothetical protein
LFTARGAWKAFTGGYPVTLVAGDDVSGPVLLRGHALQGGAQLLFAGPAGSGPRRAWRHRCAERDHER